MGRETAVVIGHRLKQDQGLAGGVGGDGDADEVGFPQLLGGNGAVQGMPRFCSMVWRRTRLCSSWE